MFIETLSTFPHMYDSVMGSSMMSIAQRKGIMKFVAHDLRDWTHDRHRTTDDDPYGGGAGLVMKCEPIFEAVDDLFAREDLASTRENAKIVFLAPQGRTFDDAYATELASCDHLLFICGHYEGIDERAYALADETISLGDYVLTGGELAALVVIDSVVRLLPGALGDEMSAQDESFSSGLLEYAQYTRPSEYRGMSVPEVLLSGDHAKVDAWRRANAIERTALLRPDLLESARLTPEEVEFAHTVVARADLRRAGEADA